MYLYRLLTFIGFETIKENADNCTHTQKEGLLWNTDLKQAVCKKVAVKQD